MLFGAIEAGGTMFVCAIGDENFNVVERVSIPTTTPSETIEQVFAFFDQFTVAAIGIGSFGPIDVNPKSSTYGYITTTPKHGWANYDLLGAVKNRYNVPTGFTTDVNTSVLGENKMGAATGLSNCLYLTIGTGIGGGAIVNGELLSGFGHPEMGHIMLRKHPKDIFAGGCPYHADCFEGLASGKSINERIGQRAETLPTDHVAWEFVAYYVAQALMNYSLILRPERIIIGGGVSKQTQLFANIKKELQRLMNDYVELPTLDEYIVTPGLGDNAGIVGCFVLAKQELHR